MEVEPSVFNSHHGGGEGGEHKFNLLVKYIVRPSIARDFIGAFKKVQCWPFSRFDLPTQQARSQSAVPTDGSLCVHGQ